MTETQTREPYGAPNTDRDVGIDTDTTVDNNDGSTKYARTVGCITRDTVSFGDETIVGDSEPNYDNAYQRHDIQLIDLDKDSQTNSNRLSFKSSMEWIGPFVALMVFDSNGHRQARCDVPKPQVVGPNTEITVEPGKAVFSPVKREDDPEDD